MAINLSTALRQTMALAYVAETPGATLKLFSGAKPSACSDSDPSGLLATGTLPTPASTATGGVVSKTGVWSFTGSAGGTIASYRLYNSSNQCFDQGTVTITGGGGDMTVDNTSIADLQGGTVTTFTRTIGGA